MSTKVTTVTADELKKYGGRLKELLKEHKEPARKMTEPEKQLKLEKLNKTKNLVKLFVEILRADGIPLPVQELIFSPTRKFRFDLAWPDHKVAMEIEGGVWMNGGHNRGKGFTKDIEKYNHAAELGWTVLRCVPDDLLKQNQLLKTILIKKTKQNG